MASGEEQLKPLRESEQNLTQLAAFIRGDLGTAATPDAVNQARQYTVDALASVAFQVFSASQALVRCQAKPRKDGQRGSQTWAEIFFDSSRFSALPVFIASIDFPSQYSHSRPSWLHTSRHCLAWT